MVLTDQVASVSGADGADLMSSRCKDLALRLAKFPRVALGHLPTPLEPMDRLSEILGGPRFWVKRDDCTGLSSGGNKTRKLEYLMADAQNQRADTIITQGATHRTMPVKLLRPLPSWEWLAISCWGTGQDQMT